MNGAIRRRGAASIVGRRQESEDESEAEGGPAGALKRDRVARAIGVSDPDRGRLPEPERHHEGERSDLQRDRVRFERRPVDQAHDQSR